MKKLEKNISKPIGPLNEYFPKPPSPPPKRIIKEDININPFLRGFMWAFLIIILMHIGLAYILL